MVVYFHACLPRTRRGLHLVLGMVLGGTLGNFVDRLRQGYVTDWLSVGIGGLRWPTFNVADSSIVVGILASWSSTCCCSTRDGGGGRRERTSPRRRPDRGRRGGGGRLDLAVSGVAGISRAHAQRLISDGRAHVDGRRGRASDRLRGGETIEVELSAPPDRRPPAASRSRCGSPTRTPRC